MPARAERQLLVKLREGDALTQETPPSEEGGIVRITRGGVPFRGLDAALEGVAGAAVRMCFPRYAPMVRRRRERRRRPAKSNLDHLLRVPIPQDIQVGPVLKALHSLPDVEWVARAPKLGPPPYVTTPPDLTGSQGYLLPGLAGGVDAIHAWTVPGGNGDGVKICVCDICYQPHQDLPVITPVGEAPDLTGLGSDELAHGTKVLGVLASVPDNNVGTCGIAHGARMMFRTVRTDVDLTDALDVVLAEVGDKELRPGDILLLEMQLVPDNVDGARAAQALTLYPAEAHPALYEAIREAAEQGIVVVECAANGNAALAPLFAETGLALWTPVRDSSAIIVGAGYAAGSTARARLGSNYGPRVDCQGWGESVATTTTSASAPDLHVGAPDQCYTASFGGTSAAGAMVAGVVGCMQGAALAECGTPWSGTQLRKWLRDDDNGGEQTDLAADGSNRIGPLPDLLKLLPRATLCPDVFLRDNLADDGSVPSDIEANSPDIIVRRAQVADPDASFGDTTWGLDDLSEEPVAGSDHFVYVRVRNRGDAGDDVLVRLYWSEAATFLTPANWRLLGEETLAGIAPDEVRVSAAFSWPAAEVPADGVALIAVAISQTQAAAFPEDFEDDDEFQTYVREHNEIAYRAIVPELIMTTHAASAAPRRKFRMRPRRRKIPLHVRPPRPGPRGPRDPRTPVAPVAPVAPHGLCGLEILTNLPAGTRIELTSAAFTSSITVKVDRDRSYRIPNVGLTSDDVATVEAQVHLPAGTTGAYRVTFRQLDGDSITGAVTMRVRATI